MTAAACIPDHRHLVAYARYCAKGYGPVNSVDWQLLKELGVIDENDNYSTEGNRKFMEWLMDDTKRLGKDSV